MSGLAAALRVIECAPDDRDALSGWRAQVAELFPPLTVIAAPGQPFSGRIRVAGTDDLRLTDIEASAHGVRRAPDRMPTRAHDFYKVSVQLSGTGVMRQDDRELRLAPGSLAIYDTGRPYELTFDGDYRFAVAMFPKHALALPDGVTGELTAYPLDVTEGLGAVLASYVVNLTAHMDVMAGSAGRRVAGTLLDLVSSVVAEALEVQATSDSPGRTALLLRVLRYIDEHLGDPDLDPARIAAAHFISTRHLYNVFAPAGASTAQWIRRRRLEGARRDLADPLRGGDAICDVAHRWGMPDADHFGRLFKEAYGVTPGRYAAERRSSATLPARV